jgi:murein DD-endopeptidase MepM/ murein hydrolase activator NlpD
MKIKDLPLSSERWHNNFKKLLVCLMIIITILTSLGIFILRDFGLGYEYYEINNNESIYVGSTMEKNFLTETIDEYLEQLNNDGYYIVSFDLNTKLIESYAIIPKSQVNDKELKEVIISSLDVMVLVTKLNIKDDETSYYFKTQEECDEFVGSLNEYIEQETDSEGLVESYKLITSKEVLEEKLNNVKTEKEKLDAEEAARKAEQERLAEQRKVTVTSRGSTVRSSYSSGVPLESYVYISSYYGTRNGNIYAWKDGTVTFAGWSGGYGNFIIVQHNDGTVSRYGHCDSFAVSAGQTVTKGQTIGYVGTTRK